MHHIYECCSNKPWSKARLLLEWRKLEKKQCSHAQSNAYGWLQSSWGRSRTHSHAGNRKGSQISHSPSEVAFTLGYCDPPLHSHASCFIHGNSSSMKITVQIVLFSHKNGTIRKQQLRRKQVWFMTRYSEGCPKDSPSRAWACKFSLLLIFDPCGKDELMLVTMTMQVFPRNTENTLPL